MRMICNGRVSFQLSVNMFLILRMLSAINTENPGETQRVVR